MESVQDMDRQKLIEDNMNLVYYTISKYYPKFIGDEDVIQEGMVGLCKAADKFDVSKGTAFSTFATMCILNEIRYYWRTNRKHNELLSLDFEIQNEGTEQCTLCDLIVGDEDVSLDLVMCNTFIKTLSDSERDLLYLLIHNTQEEVAKKLGTTQPTIARKRRSILAKWRKFNGDNQD